jgi:hypothetical protein
MRRSTYLLIAPSAVLAGFVSGCQSESRNLPNLTAEAASKLPSGKLPRIFKDPSNPYGYPYNVHETDGLSRNPDDCIKWGCIDNGDK